MFKVKSPIMRELAEVVGESSASQAIIKLTNRFRDYTIYQLRTFLRASGLSVWSRVNGRMPMKTDLARRLAVHEIERFEAYLGNQMTKKVAQG